MKSQVSLVRCATYEDPLVYDMVRQAVDLVGGMEQYVKPGQRVLLKVNLLRASEPGDAICTHPTVVNAVARLVKEAGATPLIGDSPGGPFVAPWLRSVYQRSGMVDVAEAIGAELNWDFDSMEVAHPEGHLVKRFELGTFVTNADVVIALPKLKTHSFMYLTGATKILFGAIPGTAKMGYHSRFPQPERFGDMLIDLLTLIRPALSIMDAVVAMDGEGPSAGDPFAVGALLASTDAIAMDLVAAELVGLDVRRIYPLQAAVAQGLTTGQVADVDILGESLDKVRVQGFRPPEVRQVSAGWLVKIMGNLIRNWLVAAPHSTDRCIGCGICERNCPVKAITIVDKRAQMDLKTCIRCYCCHEMCPERAIELRKPWLGRLLP